MLFTEHLQAYPQISMHLKLIFRCILWYNGHTVQLQICMLHCFRMLELVRNMMSLQRCQWLRNLGYRVDLVAQPLLFLQALLITSHLQGLDESSRAVRKRQEKREWTQRLHFSIPLCSCCVTDFRVRLRENMIHAVF